MIVAGVCRFSLVGRGDWKAYQGKSAEEVEAIALEQVKMLFTTERMNARLATFEHLTLASLRAQTDQDFIFVVLASKLMPKRFRERLEKICTAVPQVKLQFFGLTAAGEAQKKVFRELGLKFADVLQFRLDDDDCLCADYVEQMKAHTQHLMVADEEPFSATVHGVMYTKVNGPDTVIYNWPVDFFSAGAAVRHSSKSVYDFGHFALGSRFKAIKIAGRLALVTNNGTNDTDYTPDMIRKRRMSVMTPDQVRIAIEVNFGFLGDQGKKLSGITDFLMLSSAQSAMWMSELSMNGGRFVSTDDMMVRYLPRNSDTLIISAAFAVGPFAAVRAEEGVIAGNCRRLGVSALDLVVRRGDTAAYEALRAELQNLKVLQDFKTILLVGIGDGAALAAGLQDLFPAANLLALSPKALAGLALGGHAAGTKAYVIADPKQADAAYIDGLGPARTLVLNARGTGAYSKRFVDYLGLLDDALRGAADGTLAPDWFYRGYRAARANRTYQANLVERIILNGSIRRMQIAKAYFTAIDRNGFAQDLDRHLTGIGAVEPALSDK
ncbi:hypothetical protein BVG79_01653 [Ketogulonicigenium robustum]|uniref:Uncharacterized protein n=1 Tax=Ketogulonicigenium robustum TaxID=92947 RepID=A0A1W6P142_9RHOB|nr:glycosyltransferase [Ketogulonicigenium robustum]ARO14997.1 hypothetical protein BVG79_01653 [Ketogulonicigenium robustum]